MIDRHSGYGCQYTSQMHTALQQGSRLFYGLSTFILWTEPKATTAVPGMCHLITYVSLVNERSRDIRQTRSILRHVDVLLLLLCIP